MDIGIDLGTTYSVIAVKGQVELTAGYPAGTYLPECDVTIIPTPDGDSTFPSVLWIDPDDPAVVLVGQEAKQKAEEGDCPIMFAKRSIGTNEPLPLGDRTLTAREVAKHVLAHLKACAERALGEPVRRAVITHPAYFDLSQIDETRKAAIDAGFDMADPGQMMMEPAAAALAYLHADPRDPLRILTYDLGGGTFDVTVLERNQGVISLKAYDGNHLLGGYNFDRAFVEWLRGRLEAQGRVVPYNEHDPADRARRARLLQLAEQVKIRLSQQRNDKVYIPVSDRQILEDEQGRPIQIEERINCADYTALIRELLDETIARCHSALAKAALEAADLDAVLLVGGSTYAKWVVDTVSAAFEVDVDPFNPNLCVAAGAALQAADLPGMTASAGFQMRIDTPRESPLPTINFGGVVRGAEGRELTPEECGALQAILTTPEGVTTEPVGVSPSGRFVFEGLTLLEDDPSLFRIQLLDASGAPALSAEHSITYAPESSGTTEITSVLPKPLYLKTDPLTVMAEEGVTLPARCEVRLQRLHTRPIERIAVLQQNDPEPVGHILVEGIPPEAGEGRRMVIQVEINQHRQIRGTATVYGPHDNVVITAPVQLELPAVKVPTLPELQERFGELEARRQQEVVFSQDPQARLVLGGKGRKLSERIQALLAEMEPDKQEVNELVRELDRLVKPPPDDMDPPRADFQRELEECRDLIDGLGQDPQAAPLRGLVQRIEDEGNTAATTKNHRKWSTTCENLGRLHARISALVTGPQEGAAPQELPPTPMLKDHFAQRVETLRSDLEAAEGTRRRDSDYAGQWQTVCAELWNTLNQMEAAVEKVDDASESRQALAQLQLAMRPEDSLKTKIRQVREGVGTRQERGGPRG